MRKKSLPVLRRKSRLQIESLEERRVLSLLLPLLDAAEQTTEELAAQSGTDTHSSSPSYPDEGTPVLEADAIQSEAPLDPSVNTEPVVVDPVPAESLGGGNADLVPANDGGVLDNTPRSKELPKSDRGRPAELTPVPPPEPDQLPGNNHDLPPADDGFDPGKSEDSLPDRRARADKHDHVNLEARALNEAQSTETSFRARQSAASEMVQSEERSSDKATARGGASQAQTESQEQTENSAENFAEVAILAESAQGVVSAAVDGLLSDTEMDFSDLCPQGCGLLAGALPCDKQVLDLALSDFARQLNQLGEEMSRSLGGVGISPWLLTMTLGTTIYEVSRRHRRGRVSNRFSGTDRASTLTWCAGLPGSSSIEKE